MTDRERGRQAGKLERWTEIKTGGESNSMERETGKRDKGGQARLAKRWGEGGEKREGREDCRRDCTAPAPFPQNAKCDELRSQQREQTEQNPHSFVKWPR